MGMCSLTPDDMNGRHWFQVLVERQRAGYGVLPPHLGLTKEEYRTLCLDCAIRLPLTQELTEAQQLNHIRFSIEVESRALELQTLEEWLTSFECSEDWPLARIVAQACMGGDELWVSLGLESQEQLAVLMSECFPDLEAKNQPPMRWKTFFYRQLCHLDSAVSFR